MRLLPTIWLIFLCCFERYGYIFVCVFSQIAAARFTSILHKLLDIRSMAPKSSASGGGRPKAKADSGARPKAAAEPKANGTPSSRPPPKGSGRGKGKGKGKHKKLFKNPMKHWCMRISNPTPLDLQHVWCWNPPGGPVPVADCKLTYIVIGWEGVLPPQPRTPHLQIYLEVEPAIQWAKLKSCFHNAHLEPRFGPAKAAAEYCKKESQFREWGAGSHNNPRDLDKTIEWWTDFRRHIECCDTWKEVLLMDKFASMVSGKMNWVKTVPAFKFFEVLLGRSPQTKFHPRIQDPGGFLCPEKPTAPRGLPGGPPPQY